MQRRPCLTGSPGSEDLWWAKLDGRWILWRLLRGRDRADQMLRWRWARERFRGKVGIKTKALGAEMDDQIGLYQQASLMTHVYAS